MHVSTKETDENGVHILTNTVEADGPLEIASAKAKVSARVISVQRTDSGGVKVQTALEISEPQDAAPAKPKTQEDNALEYLSSKGITGDEAKAFLDKFGLSRVLAAMASDAEAAHKALDEEFDKALGRAPKSPAKEEKPAGDPVVQ